jgi:putative tryptophan/tyrosine transport system substrate-binding protein
VPIHLSRRNLIALSGAAAAWPLTVRAQQIGKVYRLGLIGNDPTIPITASGTAFVEGLRENGFIEGKNIIIEWRFAEGRSDTPDTLIRELVGDNIEVLVTSGAQNHVAAKRITTKVPIVMVNAIDPVGQGLVASLARPGGNITGLVQVPSAELAAKRIQLLKDISPQISRVAVLMNPDFATDYPQLTALEHAAESLNVKLFAVSARRETELTDALAKSLSEHADALFATNNGLNLTYRKIIIEFAAEHRLPLMHSFTEATRDGALISYATDRPALFRHAAGLAAKILKGANPADMPIEQPTGFQLTINLRTAKALGLVIPRDLLLVADEVIE